MPTIAKEFSLSADGRAWYSAPSSGAMHCCRSPGGWLIDRFGPRALITGATAGWGFFQAIAACDGADCRCSSAVSAWERRRRRCFRRVPSSIRSGCHPGEVLAAPYWSTAGAAWGLRSAAHYWLADLVVGLLAYRPLRSPVLSRCCSAGSPGGTCAIIPADCPGVNPDEPAAIKSSASVSPMPEGDGERGIRHEVSPRS